MKAVARSSIAGQTSDAVVDLFNYLLPRAAEHELRSMAFNGASLLDRTDLASGASGPGDAALVGGQGIAGGVRATGDRHGVDGRAARERQVGRRRAAIVGERAQQRVGAIQVAGSGEGARSIADYVVT